MWIVAGSESPSSGAGPPSLATKVKRSGPGIPSRAGVDNPVAGDSKGIGDSGDRLPGAQVSEGAVAGQAGDGVGQNARRIRQAVIGRLQGLVQREVGEGGGGGGLGNGGSGM